MIIIINCGSGVEDITEGRGEREVHRGVGGGGGGV